MREETLAHLLTGGATDIRFEDTKNGHTKVFFKNPAGQPRLVVCCPSTDPRGLKNSATNIRRALAG